MMTNASPTIKSDIRKSWPGILISILCLVGISAVVDWGKVGKAIVLANPNYFLPSILMLILSMLVRSYSWRILLQEKATTRQAFWALNEGYLFNNLLPFRLGELARGLLLSRSAGLPFLQIISTIVIERIFDLLMVVTLLLGTLPFVIGADWARSTGMIVGVSVFLILIVLYLVANHQAKVLTWFETLQSKMPVLQKIKSETINTLFQGLHVLQNWQRFLTVLGLMIVAWAFIVLHYYFALLAFVPDGQLLWAIFGIGVVGLGVAVPAAPAQVGVVEAVIVAVFPLLFNISIDVALAYAVVVHVIYLSVTSGLGIVGLVLDGSSIKEIYQDVRQLGRLPKSEESEGV